MHSHPPDPARSKSPPETRQTGVQLLKREPARWLPLAGLWLGLSLLVCCVAFLVERAAAQVPVPGLTISQTSSNTFQIQITNAVGYANYEIYRRMVLGDPNYPWTAPITGAQGQATFNVTNVNLVKWQEFFEAAVGSDWDGDGILNWQDSQPGSTNGGLLSITIDAPANNGIVP